jgi:hypothetical protein
LGSKLYAGATSLALLLLSISLLTVLTHAGVGLADGADGPYPELPALAQ